MSAADGLESGGEFSHYLLAEEIGRGGMGVVFRAFDRDLDREVAIKVMAEDATTGKKARERFVREARNLAKVEHPHVLPIHEVKDHQGRLYLAMRMVPSGHTLRGLLQARTRLAPGHALRLLDQIGGALDTMHRAGVVHLDLKPENILLEGPEGDEHPWLADFGLARAGGDDTTRTDRIAGTVVYMAPEQLAAAGAVGPRADLYALALVLFEALTGRQLDFTERAGVPGSLPADELIGERLRAVFGRALAAAAADRYGSAAAFLADAREALSRPALPRDAGAARGHTTTDPSGFRAPVRGGASGGRPGRGRRRWAVATVSIAVVAAAVAVPALVTRGGDGGTAGSAVASPQQSSSAPAPSTAAAPPAPATTPPPERREQAAPAPTTSEPSAAPSTPPRQQPPPNPMQLNVCANSLTVRAAPESKDETTTVATLTWGHTFVVQAVKNAAWARGYSPQVPSAKGWALREYLRRTC